METKISLVTGATSGIGYYNALHLVQQKHHVILVARNRHKAEETRSKLAAIQPGANISLHLADLSEMDSVRAAAAEILKTYPYLNRLVNNAGLVSTQQPQFNSMRYEYTVATNHLGPFLLTHLLWPLLTKASESRVINVASKAYAIAKPDVQEFMGLTQYSALRAYANSKLYNIWFTRALARRIKAQGLQHVVTHSLHPGVIGSNFGQSGGGGMATFFKLFRPFLMSTEKGAATTNFLLTHPDIARVNGLFYNRCKPEALKRWAMDEEKEEALWRWSQNLTQVGELV